jgi:hypothetical protein
MGGLGGFSSVVPLSRVRAGFAAFSSGDEGVPHWKISPISPSAHAGERLSNHSDKKETPVTTNVIEFQKPRARPASTSTPAPTFNLDNRAEWKEAVRSAWADPDRWETPKRHDPCIEIEEIGVTAVINRTDEGYWSWTIMLRDGREITSNWTYTSEQVARDEALDAVLVLA